MGILQVLSWRTTILCSTIWIVVTLGIWIVYIRTRPGLPRGVYILQEHASGGWIRGVSWLLFVLAPAGALLFLKLLLVRIA